MTCVSLMKIYVKHNYLKELQVRVPVDANPGVSRYIGIKDLAEHES